MSTVPEEHLGVVILVLNTISQQILLGKRKNAYMAGSYGLPGGRIELAEPLVEAAIRELTEETGLHVSAEQLSYQGVVRELQDTYNFIHFVFILKNPNGEPKNSEPDKCEGWEWMSLQSLPKHILRGHQAAVELHLKQKMIIDLN